MVRKAMTTCDVIIPCYNPGKEILDTIESLKNQKVSGTSTFKVSIINDASTNETYLNEVEEKYPWVEQINLLENKGRSGACHYGAEVSASETFIFLDSDCVLENKNLLDLHLKKLFSGLEVSIGKVDAVSNQRNFWDEYFKNISHKRDKKGLNQHYEELTSAFLAIKRETYFSVGGFDKAYTAYGFEDRDLLIRLVSSGARVGYDPEIVVHHKASLNLNSICVKMKTAGESTSGIFACKHPKTYEKMSYSKIDVCIHPVLKFPLKLTWALFNKTVNTGEALIRSDVPPYQVKVFIVLFFSSLYFSKGTLIRSKSSNLDSLCFRAKQ